MLGLATLSMAPATASADHNNIAFGFGIGAQRAGVWVPPVYETRARTIVEPAVIENRVRNVWREPVHEERRVAVTIPADVIERHVPKYDRFGNVIGFETIREVVRPARTEWRVERVCVSEGRWERVVERVMVKPETSRVVYEQVLVAPGHWAQPNRLVINKDRNNDWHLNVGWAFRR
jgi:hypothetical protein